MGEPVDLVGSETKSRSAEMTTDTDAAVPDRAETPKAVQPEGDVPYFTSDHWTGELEGLWTETDPWTAADTAIDMDSVYGTDIRTETDTKAVEQQPMRYEDALKAYLEGDTRFSVKHDVQTGSPDAAPNADLAAVPEIAQETAPKPKDQVISELAPKLQKPGITPGRATIAAQETYADAQKRFGTNAQTVLEQLQPGQDPRRFLDGFQNAYILGKQGAGHDALKNSSAAGYLNKDQKLVAYEMGMQAADTSTRSHGAEVNTSRTEGKDSVGRKAYPFFRLDASGIFVNKKERLYRFAQKVKAVDGYTDFVCHADPDGFYIDMAGDGNPEDMVYYSPEEFAKVITSSKKYSGGRIRILSCQAGAKENGAAYRLACALKEEVLAPTEIVNVDEDGNIFLSDNDILAEIWYNATDKGMIKETGKWRLFSPGEEGKK